MWVVIQICLVINNHKLNFLFWQPGINLLFRCTFRVNFTIVSSTAWYEIFIPILILASQDLVNDIWVVTGSRAFCSHGALQIDFLVFINTIHMLPHIWIACYFFLKACFKIITLAFLDIIVFRMRGVFVYAYYIFDSEMDILSTGTVKFNKIVKKIVWCFTLSFEYIHNCFSRVFE